MKHILAALLTFLSIATANAQTSPHLRQGQVLTPAQWNQLFINKQDTLGYTPLNIAGGTMTGRLITASVPNGVSAGLNLTPGSAPPSPVNGDLWMTSAGMFGQINGSTVAFVGASALAQWQCPVGTVAMGRGSGTGFNCTSTPSLSQVIAPNIYGGDSAGSTLSLQSTSNGSPSGDLLALTGSSIRFQNFGLSRAYYDFYDHFARSQMQLRGIVKRDTDNVRSIAGIINPGFAIDDGVQRVGDIDFLVCGSGGVANADCDGLGTGETLQAGLAIIGPVTGLGGGGLIPFTDNSYIIGWPSQRFKDLQVVTGTFGGILTAELGVVVSGGGVQIANANTLSWANGSSLYGAATTGAIASTFRLTGAGSTTALNFGGDTSSFPALVRNGTTLKARLADDSADAPLTAGTIASAAQTITSSSANALAVGRQGATSPAFNVDASTALSATGLNVKAAAAAGGLAVSVLSSGTNENLTIDAKGSGTITLGGTSTGAIIHTRATTLSAALTYGGVTLSNAVTGTGNMVLSASPTLTGTITAAGANFSGAVTSAAHAITSASANAVVAGVNGSTNPAFNVDASTASSATGLNVKSAAAAGGVALSVLSSGTNENLTIDAKGSGTITLGGTSTGAIIHTRATTLSAALTYGGVTLSNAVTGTGNMVLSASPTLTGTLTAAAISASGTVLGSGGIFTADGASFGWGDSTASIVGNSSANVFVFYTASTERLRISNSFVASSVGIVSSDPSGGVGYSTGSGGAVTQGISRTTGVTLDRVTGAITLFSAAGTTTYQTFTVTNSTVAATDIVNVVQKSGTDKYNIHVTAVGAGSFDITYRTTGGTTTEQPVFHFAVIKGATT